MFDIITIGSATKDVFLISKGFKIIRSRQFKTGYGECFAYGSKVELGDIHTDTGGGATNTAVTFKNFGLKTSIVSRVGQDVAGEEVISFLKKRKIDTSNIAVDQREKTAYSTILLTLGGERTILVYRGASADFSLKDFKWPRLKAKWFYVTSLGGNLKVFKAILKHAAKNKIKVAWNPGSAELAWPKKTINQLLDKVEILLLNREEAMHLQESFNKTAVALFREMNKMKMSRWSISDGRNGAYVSDKENVYFAPALKVTAVNVTGAGDAFGSGLVAGLVKKYKLPDALKLGLLNAAGVVSRMGAKTGILVKRPVERQLKKIKVINLQ